MVKQKVEISNLTITATSKPECESFIKIIENGKQYTIDEFAEKHKDANIFEFYNAVKASNIMYRGVEKKYSDITSEYLSLSKGMEFFEFQPPMLLKESSDRAAVAFVKSASDCLQNARYFTMSSALILDTNENIKWKGGYIPHFAFRTVYFSTAIDWYSNCFDHILQIIYWGYCLFTSAKDRTENVYDSSWDIKRIMQCCTYEFVVEELKARGLISLKKVLTGCMNKIQDVRSWANYIKHKGGIEYKYLKAPFPVQFGYQAVNENKYTFLDEYLSPISIDIDDQITALSEAHSALFICLTEVVNDINFNSRAIQ